MRLSPEMEDNIRNVIDHNLKLSPQEGAMLLAEIKTVREERDVALKALRNFTMNNVNAWYNRGGYTSDPEMCNYIAIAEMALAGIDKEQR